ncbi:hypothetical protein ACWIG3_35375 [Streptomyces celluloflavus]|uniref:hypothetical protein n=1 Tax=Streptomyces TaxID=1883 RepID=UPI00069A9250|nr:hypothetical protein [Streptomyces sp. SID7805]MYU52933.1 hypothetical protein [Streptomyces sp. SID7805]
MTKHVKPATSHSVTSGTSLPSGASGTSAASGVSRNPSGAGAAGHPGRRSAADPESLAQLRGDCARMAPRWRAGRSAAPAPGRAAELRGVEVPAASAALVDGMSEYGD